ncbi:hypothetical protein EIP91_010813 [Steccherinum ochraceum]|uniref:SET domain-containing protein n=1 Tax=Steccherinum ochraceum TaxID=92696 RepID=A0A4R0RML0_9APHY|nr:hypothetical protein EIP91_010813 [Steccherinum ochraceum]
MIDTPSSPNNGALEVRTTPYAGRSYFSTRSLPENSCILDIATPYSYTIYKKFRSEVCSECFKYDGGRRAFLTCRQYGESAGLSFCDTGCRDSWLANEGPTTIDLLTTLEGARRKGKQKATNDAPPSTKGTAEDIAKSWEEVRRKEQSGKEVRRWGQLGLDDFQADMARYVLLALSHLFQEVTIKPSSDGHVDIGTLDGEARWEHFTSLQTSEQIRVGRFPELLDDHIKIYQVLRGLFGGPGWNVARATLTEEQERDAKIKVCFSDVITIENVRIALGVDAGNSFGIWERPLMDNSELLGFAVYPVPSFLNHNCSPNVQSSGDGRRLRFLTTKDVAAGDQLSISYGHVENLPLRERQRELLDGWFFECVCTKCLAEGATAKG